MVEDRKDQPNQQQTAGQAEPVADAALDAVAGGVKAFPGTLEPTTSIAQPAKPATRQTRQSSLTQDV